MSLNFLGNVAISAASYIEYAANMGLPSMTVSMWFYPTTNDSVCLFRTGSATVAATQNMMRTQSASPTQLYLGATGQITSNTNGVILNQWNHAAFSLQRYVILNGDTTGAYAGAAWGFNGGRVNVGMRRIGTNTFTYGIGTADTWKFSDVAVWNSLLSVDELVALYKGVHPLRIKPANLYAYWPLWGFESGTSRSLITQSTFPTLTWYNSPTGNTTSAPPINRFTPSFMNMGNYNDIEAAVVSGNWFLLQRRNELYNTMSMRF